MSVQSGYPNLEVPQDFENIVMDMLRAWYPDELGTRLDGTLLVATDAPANLGDRVREHGYFARVSDIGAGGGRNRLEDRAHVDIDVFGKSRASARDLAVGIQARLEGYPHSLTVDGGFVLIDEVITLMRPQRVAWADGTIRRFYSSYQFSARR